MDPINTLVTAADELPVSLADIKAHCRIDHDDEDGLLNALIAAATQHVEERTGKQLVEQTWETAWDGRCLSRLLVLPVAPVLQVSSIAYVDREGADDTANLADFHAVKNEDEAWLEPKSGNAWPAIAPEPNALSITYTAGFGAPADVPANLTLAIKQTVAHWYEHRQAVVMNNQMVEMPMSVQVLINQSRIGWVGA